MLSEQSLSEQMRKIALDLPVPDDLTNREYWLRTEILEWVDKTEALRKREEMFAQLCAEAESVLDNQPFKVVKETWEDWERWKMAAMRLSEEIEEALAGGDDE